MHARIRAMVCSTGALVETSNPILRAISLMRAGFNGIPPASIASIKLLACASGDVDTLRPQTRSDNFFQSAKSGILLEGTKGKKSGSTILRLPIFKGAKLNRFKSFECGIAFDLLGKAETNDPLVESVTVKRGQRNGSNSDFDSQPLAKISFTQFANLKNIDTLKVVSLAGKKSQSRI